MVLSKEEKEDRLLDFFNLLRKHFNLRHCGVLMQGGGWGDYFIFVDATILGLEITISVSKDSEDVAKIVIDFNDEAKIRLTRFKVDKKIDAFIRELESLLRREEQGYKTTVIKIKI